LVLVGESNTASLLDSERAGEEGGSVVERLTAVVVGLRPGPAANLLTLGSARAPGVTAARLPATDDLDLDLNLRPPSLTQAPPAAPELPRTRPLRPCRNLNRPCRRPSPARRLPHRRQHRPPEARIGEPPLDVGSAPPGHAPELVS
jgi:hypothetical protein